MILRVGGHIGSRVGSRVRKEGRPYGVEVVSDPYDTLAPNAIKHPLRPFFRWSGTWRLRRLCEGACAASYVTERVLQRRYPPAPQAFTTHYSSVELPAVAFADAPRAPTPAGVTKLIFIGTMAQLYKGPDVLIDAVGACSRRGLGLELVLVGSGRYQAELESRAVALGLKLGRQIHFRGQLTTPEAVRAELDRAHLFVLPSRVEGLPRAMIEAMARALPCLASTVGGIQELLPAEDLVPPNDTAALTQKICEVLSDAARMRQMSARNLEKAREYGETLGDRRLAFYRCVEDRTGAWLRGCSSLAGSTPAGKGWAFSPASHPAWDEADPAPNPARGPE